MVARKKSFPPSLLSPIVDNAGVVKHAHTTKRRRRRQEDTMKEALWEGFASIGGRGVGSWEGDQTNFSWGGSGFWTPRGGNKLSLSEGGKGGE